MSTQTENTVKKGLVLGGGGSKGSYTIGVLSALKEENRTYDVVTGISIGALVGALYAQNQPEIIDEWAQSFTSTSSATGLFDFPNRMSTANLSAPDFNTFIADFQENGPSVAPLHQSFSDLFNYEKFKNSPIDYACLAVNLTKNQEAVFTKKDMTEDNAIDALLASAAYFPAFSFHKIGDDYYADGGYLKYTLGTQALAMGAQDLTVVSLKDPWEQVDYMQGETSLFIRPILKLSYFLDFEKPDLERQIAQGRLEALKYMDKVPGYIYTFYPDDYFLLDTLSKLAAKVVEPLGISLTNDSLIQGITTLLEYQPAPLYNSYMNRPQAGLILECLALTAGIDPIAQYHLLDFVKQILHKLEYYQINLPDQGEIRYTRMEKGGINDLLFFFHSALKVYNGKLPDEFDFICAKFKSLYYLALAWHILDKFSAAIDLF